MGERWSVDRGDIAVGNFRLTSGSPRELVGWHNTDCDAYEARIAELTAELARVKAESLRVVVTEEHELGRWEVAMAAFIGGPTTIYERYDSDDGQLVRLERWETEDGN